MSQPEENERSEGNAPAVIEESSLDAEVQARRERMQPGKFESFMALLKAFIIRALIMYFIVSCIRRISQPQDIAEPTKVGATNIFNNGARFDLFAYVSDSSLHDFKRSDLVWQQENLVYGDWSSGDNFDGTYSHNIQIPTTESIRQNGSIFLHFYVTFAGKSPDPKAGKFYAGSEMSYISRRLNKFKKLKYTMTHNLLTGETDKSEIEIEKSKLMKEEIISHWHPNLTLNVITDQTKWVLGAVPPPLDEHVNFSPGGEKYTPILFINDFWNMMRDYRPINETTELLDLHLTYQPLSLMKWQMYAAQTMRNKFFGNTIMDVFPAEEQDEDQDALKEALLETNPYLIGITVIVSVLHSVFELLAFKNDIQFWNNRKSLEGLSVRSVFFNVFQSVIVLLYVMDNEANTLIRISCMLGLGIEVWKIQKVVDIKVDRENKILGFLPKISYTDKGSYVESSTRQYDILAFRYLSWACFPLLFGYGVYSLLYLEHKGWYSFILNMLYGFLLTFGFIMMTPQLFINYKLKSVAHLPWRMMSYKFLNTFIDDIFAFIIKMPTMYRLGCFRDDIVFFIFLYQRWIYKVDKTRVNEFGYCAEMDEQQPQQQINGSLAVTDTPPEAAPPKPIEQKKKD